MGVFEQFPYVNFHELNLSWIVNKLKELEEVIGTQIVDIVARAGVAANAQAIQDLSNTVDANAITAHNETVTAQNTADAAASAASVADGKAVAAQNTANAANTTANAVAGRFSSRTVTVEAGQLDVSIMDMFDVNNEYVVFIEGNVVVNNVGCIYGVYKTASQLYLSRFSADTANNLSAVLNTNGTITNNQTQYAVQYRVTAVKLGA